MASKFEKRCKAELKERGWTVDTKHGMHKWSKNNDYFKLFDILALRAGDPLRFIAIKGQKGVPSKLRSKIEKFWLPDSCQKEIWYYRKLASDRRKFVAKKEVWIDGEWKKIE